MADLDVTVRSDVDPATAWALASDLRRFDEWLTIFGGWKSDVPDEIAEGTSVKSLIKVKGFRNTIAWRVTRYDEPTRIGLEGSGRGGVRITLDLTVSPDGDGSRFRVAAELTGGLLSGPVGRMVAKVIEGDVRRSVDNLAALR
ncbi:MAG: SRPBCC family protein [Williamsia herbipolensis]|uniref:Carbon monoxide dehydrogenase subunit G n=1 Tax=Williamsia serinedens TaxID=391736 RepID=A0ABT1GXR5_9NOCA|nr:SRPBCC family protein [Williamsia serinedens]MBE7160989.1 SRPBCC family protein [Williamsia herbipolensis]MCP2159342.1 Carbon monoxide dehydrogenase subunit G [Williamsia serinedens]